MNPQEQSAPQSAPQNNVTTEAQPPVESPQQAPQNVKSLTLDLEDDLKFEVTSEKLDDMRFFKLFKEVDENILKVYDVIEFMVGSAGMEKIYAYYESKGQKFKITKMMPAFRAFTEKMNADPDFLDFSAF